MNLHQIIGDQSASKNDQKSQSRTDLDGVLPDEEDVSGLVPPLVAEEDVRVQVAGGARGVLRHPVAVVDVVGHALRRLLVQQLPAKAKRTTCG